MRKTILLSAFLVFAVILSACTININVPANSEPSPAGSAESSAVNSETESSALSELSPEPASEESDSAGSQAVTTRFKDTVQAANVLYASEPGVRYLDLSIRPEFLESEDWDAPLGSIQGPCADIQMQADDFLYFLRTVDQSLYHQQRYASAVYEDALILFRVNPLDGEAERDPAVACLQLAQGILNDWRSFVLDAFERLHADQEWKPGETTDPESERFSLIDTETRESLTCSTDRDGLTTIEYVRLGADSGEELVCRMYAGTPSEKLLLISDADTVPNVALQEFRETLYSLSDSLRAKTA